MHMMNLFEKLLPVSLIGADDSSSSASHAAGSLHPTVVNQLAANALMFNEAALLIVVPTPQGTPDSFSLAVKIRHGDTSSPTTNYAHPFGIPTQTGATNDGTTLTITAAGVYMIPFSPAKLKQYYEAYATLAFVNGTSPTCSYTVFLLQAAGEEVEVSVHETLSTLGIQQ